MADHCDHTTELHPGRDQMDGYEEMCEQHSTCSNYNMGYISFFFVYFKFKLALFRRK